VTTQFERQLDILPQSMLVHPVTIIGLGGIGSPTAYCLRKMGFKHFSLWDYNESDHGILESHNVPSQHYDQGDVGSPKVFAVKRQLETALGGDPCIVETHCTEFTKHESLEGIVIGGVDTMHARQSIWSAVKSSRAFVPLYVDGRIGVVWDHDTGTVTGEWIQVFSLMPSRLEDREFYEEGYLWDDDYAEPLRCTAQAVAYISFLVAGFIGAAVRMWATGKPVPRLKTYECLTADMMTSPANWLSLTEGQSVC